MKTTIQLTANSSELFPGNNTVTVSNGNLYSLIPIIFSYKTVSDCRNDHSPITVKHEYPEPWDAVKSEVFSQLFVFHPRSCERGPGTELTRIGYHQVHNNDAGGTPIKNGRRCSSEILKRTRKRYQDPILWAWLEMFSPLGASVLKQHIN